MLNSDENILVMLAYDQENNQLPYAVNIPLENSAQLNYLPSETDYVTFIKMGKIGMESEVNGQSNILFSIHVGFIVSIEDVLKESRLYRKNKYTIGIKKGSTPEKKICCKSKGNYNIIRKVLVKNDVVVEDIGELKKVIYNYSLYRTTDFNEDENEIKNNQGIKSFK